MGSEPRSQQGPAPFHGVDVDLAKSVWVIVTRVLAFGMAECLVGEPPFRQSRVDFVFIRVDQGPGFGDGVDDRLDGFLLDVGKHAHYNLTAARDHAEDRRLFLAQACRVRALL
jgi:hypothetical protein